MHIFHSCENIKTCIFTAFDIFTGGKPTTFFLFAKYGLREAALDGISVSFQRETTTGTGVSYFYGNVNKKSQSLRSLIKERAFINSSATTRKSKQTLM